MTPHKKWLGHQSTDPIDMIIKNDGAKSREHNSTSSSHPDNHPTEPLQVCLNEAARLLSISRRSLNRLIATGQIPVIRYGGIIRIAIADLLAWQRKNRIQIAEEAS